jgi:TonB family protein
MTNSTIPAEAVGSPSPVTASFRWEVPNKAISIQISLDLIDRLEREVIESFKAVTKRGSEIGGVLLGRIAHGDKRTVFVENCEPVACDYSRGPLYLLSDPDKDQLRQAMQRLKSGPLSVVGFFRSNTRKDLVIDQDEDFALGQEFFPDANQVFLLVKPFAMKPSAAGFFLWEEGHIQAESALQFPFRRSELMKLFPESIVQPGAEKASAATAPATVAREERSGPVIVPKREERPPVAPPPILRQEPAKPGPVAVPPKREESSAPPPPLSFKREERPVIVTPPPKREEPSAPLPPLSFKREERPPVAPPLKPEQPPAPAPPLSFKREERPPVAPPLPKRDQAASPVSFKREERAAAPPMAQKREERPAPPPLSFRREERSTGAVPVQKREEPPQPAVTAKREEPLAPPVVVKREEPAPPPVVAKREEPAPPPVVPKREEPAPPPVVAKREEPAPPPVVAKREERPAVFPKPEERPAPAPTVAAPAPPVAPKLEEPPKREERPAVQPIVVKREEPAFVPPAQKKEERKEERVAVAPAPPKPASVPAAIPVRAPEPLVAVAAAEPAKRGKPWIGIGAVAAVVLLVGGWYVMHSRSTPTGAVPVDSSLGLKVERNASGLVLSWNRNADIVKTAQKATLTITDGASTEDDDIDLGTLRAGSILYSPLTNDVGFKLEVSDLKTRKSLSESIRALSGHLTAAVQPPVPLPKPANPTPPVANPTGTTPVTPRPATPAPPTVTVTPPAPGSLGTRLSALPPPTPTPAATQAPAEPPPTSNASIPSNPAPVAPVKVAPPPDMRPEPPAAPRVVTPVQQPPAPIQPVVVQQKPAPLPGGNIVPPRVTSKVAPVYPAPARAMGISGDVRVEAIVGKDGKVKSARAVSGPQVLRAEAEKAVRQWKYTPGTLNGEPVEVPVNVDVGFQRR